MMKYSQKTERSVLESPVLWAALSDSEENAGAVVGILC